MTNQELKVTNMPTIPNEKTWPHKLRKFINKNIPSIKHWLRVDELQNPLQIYQFFFPSKFLEKYEHINPSLIRNPTYKKILKTLPLKTICSELISPRT